MSKFKRNLLLTATILLPVLCFSLYAQVGVAPSRQQQGNAIAAYVFGAENSANAEELAEAVVNNLTADRRYAAPRRGAREFFREADRAQARSRGRLLSDRDFCRIGDDFGVNFLVIIDIERQGRGNSVWARILDLGNCQVAATAEYTGPIRNTSEIRAGARALSNELLNARIGRRGARIAYASHGAPAAPVHRPRGRGHGVGVDGIEDDDVVANEPVATQTVQPAPQPVAQPVPQPAPQPAAQPVTQTPPVQDAETSLRQDRDRMLERLDAAVGNAPANANASAANTFTDSRDGKTYRTVTIGNQVWMAENLNFEPSSKSGDSWCYDNNPTSCDKYGRLYDWNTAIIVCPAGWRLPTKENWDNLEQAAGGNVAGTRLKVGVPDWNGTDDFDFSALPSGYRDTNGSFWHVGTDVHWWTATESGDNAYYKRMYTDLAILNWYLINKAYGFSVRCIRD